MEEKKNFLKKYAYCLLVLYVPIYIGLFFVVEKVVPTTGYWSSYCMLDDYIPFNEYFVIPYYCWYPYLVIIGLFLMFKDKEKYKLYMYMIIVGFSISLVVCLLFPNGQDLRPASFSGDNVFIELVRNMYRLDTNTNVLPSIHVYGAIVGAVGITTTEAMKNTWIKGGVVCIGVLIAASTCLIKQHSILDGFAAVVLYVIIYSFLQIFIFRKKQILKIS